MTEKEINFEHGNLSELAQAALGDDKRATPGPWESCGAVHNGKPCVCCLIWSLPTDVPVASTGVDSKPGRHEDTLWIAAARAREPLLAQGVVNLLAEVDCMRGLLVSAREHLASHGVFGLAWMMDAVVKGKPYSMNGEGQKLIARVEALEGALREAQSYVAAATVPRLSGVRTVEDIAAEDMLAKIDVMLSKGGSDAE